MYSRGLKRKFMPMVSQPFGWLGSGFEQLIVDDIGLDAGKKWALLPKGNYGYAERDPNSFL
jgi:hypothetical protein